MAFNSGHQTRKLRPAKWGPAVKSHCENLEPPMSVVGHERRFCDVCRTSALPPILTVTADILNRQLRATKPTHAPQQTPCALGEARLSRRPHPLASALLAVLSDRVFPRSSC